MVKDYLPESAEEVAKVRKGKEKQEAQERVKAAERLFSALPVPETTVEELVRDMKRSVALRGGLGMAAPQVGVSTRLFVMPNLWRLDSLDLQEVAETGNVVRQYLRMRRNARGDTPVVQEGVGEGAVGEQGREQRTHSMVSAQRRHPRGSKGRRRGRDWKQQGRRKERQEEVGDDPISAFAATMEGRASLSSSSSTTPEVDAWLDEMYSAVINPRITWESQRKVRNYEGCYSVPGFIGLVTRADRIRVELDCEKTGERKEIMLNGDAAHIFQHEYDHLEGVIWVDRLDSREDVEKDFDGSTLRTDKGFELFNGDDEGTGIALD